MTENTHTNEPHVLPLSIYLGIGSILIFLTAGTVYAAGIDFGAYNLLIAMAIATIKASLVAMYFMHLKYDNKLYLLLFLSAIVFLAIFIVITMFDTLRRGDIYEIKSGAIRDAVIYDSLPADTTTHAIADSLSISTDTTDVVIDTTH